MDEFSIFVYFQHPLEFRQFFKGGGCEKSLHYDLPLALD